MKSFQITNSEYREKEYETGYEIVITLRNSDFNYSQEFEIVIDEYALTELQHLVDGLWLFNKQSRESDLNDE